MRNLIYPTSLLVSGISGATMYCLGSIDKNLTIVGGFYGMIGGTICSTLANSESVLGGKLEGVTRTLSGAYLGALSGAALAITSTKLNLNLFGEYTDIVSGLIAGTMIGSLAGQIGENLGADYLSKNKIPKLLKISSLVLAATIGATTPAMIKPISNLESLVANSE